MGGGLPHPAPKGGAMLSASMLAGKPWSRPTLSSFMYEQRKVPKERYLKSVDSASSHNSADFKVSRYPAVDCRKGCCR